MIQGFRDSRIPFFSFILARRQPTMWPHYQGHLEDGLEKVKMVTYDCGMEASPHHIYRTHKKGQALIA